MHVPSVCALNSVVCPVIDNNIDALNRHKPLWHTLHTFVSILLRFHFSTIVRNMLIIISLCKRIPVYEMYLCLDCVGRVNLTQLGSDHLRFFSYSSQFSRTETYGYHSTALQSHGKSWHLITFGQLKWIKRERNMEWHRIKCFFLPLPSNKPQVFYYSFAFYHFYLFHFPKLKLFSLHLFPKFYTKQRLFYV